MDPFRAWLRSYHLLLDRASTQAPSHLLLSGGKALVREQDNAFFLAKYASQLDRGIKPYVVELRTECFRLMFDLDIKAASPLTIAQQIQLSLHIHAAIANTFETAGGTVLCTSPPQQLEDGRYKTGIHLVQTDVYVNSATALAFRAHIIQAHKSVAVGSDMCLLWEEIIDSQVYTSAGLRMVGSRKKESEGVYSATHILYDDDVTSTEGYHTKALIKLTSIRTFTEELTPLSAPLPSVTLPQRSGSSRASRRCLDDYQQGLDAMRATLPAVYSDITFIGLKAVGDVYILQSSCRFCLNADREHASNKVFFQLTPEGVQQRCYSQKEGDGRFRGSCRTFRSNTFPMPLSLSLSLWPDGPNKKARLS